MNLDVQALFSGYLDDALTAEEQAALAQWIRESPLNARQFADAVLLHDRLRAEQIALVATSEQPLLVPPSTLPRQPGRRLAIAGISLAAVFVLVLGWYALTGTPAAAMTELQRIRAANAQAVDRTFEIQVEEIVSASSGRQPATDRPPKPPLDRAKLHVRGSREFVLIRQTADGLPFVTGSDGRTSWAVRPDGPVRVSPDLTRFSRDLPGHENSLPLTNLEDGLERLREAYQLEVLPVESDGDEGRSSAGDSRLMVAVKKRGFRGPNRVEISYAVGSGLIQELRFVGMPYGPERLTIRLTLVNQQPLAPDFFGHEAHHDPSRRVEFEE